MLKFSPPPKAARNADFIARRLKEAIEGDGPRESVTVEWNGRPLHVGVINMPLRDVYYNPATHRIRAQRDHDPVLAKTLESDPWLEESQEYLNRLLVGRPTSPEDPDPDFIALMNSLGEVDQQEPGLITHEGILVNGNTRAAALRKLKKTSIRVGVLPLHSPGRTSMQSSLHCSFAQMHGETTHTSTACWQWKSRSYWDGQQKISPKNSTSC